MSDVVDRRRAMALGLSAAVPTMALLSSSARAVVPGLLPGSGKTYLLVHGAWGGSWFWGPVVDRLRAQGHRVFALTLTGLGDRKHLLSPAVTLDTFVEDITNLMESEELAEVILVGHSFGGFPVSGAADRASDRIRRVVFLDAVMPQRSGQSFFDCLPPEVAAARRRAAIAGPGGTLLMAPPPPTALPQFGIAPGPVADWFTRHNTPHPVATLEGSLQLQHPIGGGRPCTYVSFTNPPLSAPEGSRGFARSQPSWTWAELAVGHAAPASAPDEVAALLSRIE